MAIRNPKVAEAGLEWYVMKMGNGMRLLSDDCDEFVLSDLVLHENRVKLTLIEGDIRPDVGFGRRYKIIAAVLTGGKIVYKSPGFDLEAYIQEQSQNKEEKKDEK